MTDHALDALLADYAPPLPAADLVGRIVAAAVALPQVHSPAPALHERGTPRHDRRRNWLRRPLLAGGIALGIAVSGAVAATLAGVRIDRLPLVEAVIARLPFLSEEPEPQAPPAPAPPAAQAPEGAPTVEPPTETQPLVSSRVEAPQPRAVLPQAEAAPPAVTEEQPAPPPPAREERIRPPVELPPPLPPPAREAARPPAPVVEPRSATPTADEQLRLQRSREQAERTARLRAARQAQIERLQRVQQRRERIRRLRRD